MFYLQQHLGMKLNLDLKAPEIILPSPTDESSRLVVQLGHIQVSNTFMEEHRESVVPLDSIAIRVFDIRVFTLLSDATCTLAEDIELKASVLRALAPSTPQLKVLFFVLNFVRILGESTDKKRDFYTRGRPSGISAKIVFLFNK